MLFKSAGLTVIRKAHHLLVIVAISLATPGFSQVNLNSEVLGRFTFDGRANDVWGWNGPDGLEIGIVGVGNGVVFGDITDPENTEEVGFIEGPSSIWHDMKVYKHYCYIVSDGGAVGVQIVDMSNAPESVSLVKAWQGDDMYQVEKSHNVWIDTAQGLMYLVGNSGRETVVASLEDPESPKVVSLLNGESHDMHTWGNWAAVSNGRSGSVTIWDMTDPSDPEVRTTIRIPESGYSHNNWFTDDGNFILTTEETNGKTVKIWDITDLDNPVMADEWLSTPDAMAHNVYVYSNVAYISHYGASFRMLDISDPYNIEEVARHDPGGSSWGAFGGFKSGNFIHGEGSTLYILGIEPGIIISDVLNRGFHLDRFSRNGNVVKLNLPANVRYTLDVFNAGGQLIDTRKGISSGSEDAIVMESLRPGYFLKPRADGTY